METPEQFLDAKALAARYDVHEGTIWRWNAERRIPAPTKLAPGSTRWRLSSILEWEHSRDRAEGAAA